MKMPLLNRKWHFCKIKTIYYVGLYPNMHVNLTNIKHFKPIGEIIKWQIDKNLGVV